MPASPSNCSRLLHRPTHLPALPHQDTHSPPGKSAKCGLRVLSQAPPCGDGCQDGICPGRKCMTVPPDPTVPLSNPAVNTWASLRTHSGAIGESPNPEVSGSKPIKSGFELGPQARHQELASSPQEAILLFQSPKLESSRAPPLPSPHVL